MLEGISNLNLYFLIPYAMARGIMRYSIERLPESIKKEVYEFAEFLMEKHEAKIKRKKPNFGWKGALRDLKGKYTSIELQHKVTEWRKDI